jgi:hypothetical protein
MGAGARDEQGRTTNDTNDTNEEGRMRNGESSLQAGFARSVATKQSSREIM